jgi:hypothetical protein
MIFQFNGCMKISLMAVARTSGPALLITPCFVSATRALVAAVSAMAQVTDRHRDEHQQKETVVLEELSHLNTSRAGAR